MLPVVRAASANSPLCFSATETAQRPHRVIEFIPRGGGVQLDTTRNSVRLVCDRMTVLGRLPACVCVCDLVDAPVSRIR